MPLSLLIQKVVVEFTKKQKNSPLKSSIQLTVPQQAEKKETNNEESIIETEQPIAEHTQVERKKIKETVFAVSKKEKKEKPSKQRSETKEFE